MQFYLDNTGFVEGLEVKDERISLSDGEGDVEDDDPGLDVNSMIRRTMLKINITNYTDEPAGGWPPAGRIVMTPERPSNYYLFSVCLSLELTWMRAATGMGSSASDTTDPTDREASLTPVSVRTTCTRRWNRDQIVK
jgi:hypothetical protein